MSTIMISGGPDIQHESDDYLKGKGPLADGAVCVTSAGKLPCRILFHAVGPRWRKGDGGEQQVLYDCVQNLLKRAQKENVSTIVIPAISSGIFGFPMNISTDTIVKSLQAFVKCEAHHYFTEIHFIDVKQDGIDSFTTSLDATWPRAEEANSSAHVIGMSN